MKLYLFLLLLPFIEITGFIVIGDEIGVLMTLLWIVLAAMLGSALLQYQGVAILANAHNALRAGRMPLAEIFDGVCIAVAGLLLIIPGFVTDMMAAGLLLPPARNALRRYLASRGDFRAEGYSYDGEAIETEYQRLDDDKLL